MKQFLTYIALFLPAIVFAIPPHVPDLIQGGNRWLITFYDDSSVVHNQWATQGICFYYAGVIGTHQRYTWVSDTYPDWNGRASQEGDQIFMHGDFQWPYGNIDGGHDGMEWELVTRSYVDEGAGHWKEWVEDGLFGITIGFGNTKLVRVGGCVVPANPDFNVIDPNANQALEMYRHIEVPRGENGEVVSPVGLED